MATPPPPRTSSMYFGRVGRSVPIARKYANVAKVTIRNRPVTSRGRAGSTGGIGRHQPLGRTNPSRGRRPSLTAMEPDSPTIGILVVAYNAETTLRSVLQRITP